MIEPYCPFCGHDAADAIGVQVRGLYDGVLIWECAACQHQWPRFLTGRLHLVALDEIRTTR